MNDFYVLSSWAVIERAIPNGGHFENSRWRPNNFISKSGYTTLFRQTLFQHFTVGTSGGWLQLNRPTGSTDWKDADPNPENQGAIWAPYWVWHFKILVRKFEKPDPIKGPISLCMGLKLPRCLNQCRAFDACNTSNPTNVFFSNFYCF